MPLDPSHIADRFLAGSDHRRSIALMKFLAGVANRLGVGEHVYVVGGAVRNFLINVPIKDVDLVVDSLSLGHDSEWFAQQLSKAIPVPTTITTNNYGVAILSVQGDWVVHGEDLSGEQIEIANARKESYTDGGYKPTEVEPATMGQDVLRRELSYNTLLWRLMDLADGPDKAEIIDLTGCGVKDLQEGIMRCPADPDKTFADDASRMIRVIKFALRYGHRLTPDTKAAIIRNSRKIKNVPPSHLSKLLIEIVLTDKNWKAALEMLADLGLLEPVKEVFFENKSFQAALLNHVNNSKMEMLFGLMDVGLPVGTKIQFLSPPQQDRLREITFAMETDDAWEFLDKLKTPGNAFEDSAFQPSLVAEFGIGKKDMGAFFTTVAKLTRVALLNEPELSSQPETLKQIVRLGLH